ncbi:DUF2797 domain-containing protein [Ichthyobacterium seriolicida]|nr:DUF2797 domain-containing protein [Ichthyobacterium seriolicida]
MHTEYASPVRYFLNTESGYIELNKLISREFSIEHLSSKCVFCEKTVDKIYRQGHCYSCFWESPQTNESIFRPELSKAHLGIEVKDLEWEKKIELQPHVVYLAITDDIKIGITRKSGLPTRWIDQGAIRAISIAETPNRYLAGLIEVSLKEIFRDKTNWRKMLTNEISEIDIYKQRDRAIKYLDEDLKVYLINDSSICDINYPLESRLNSIKTLNIEKESKFQSTLKGIKGQYLVFENDTVFNIRNNQGEVIKIKL